MENGTAGILLWYRFCMQGVMVPGLNFSDILTDKRGYVKITVRQAMAHILKNKKMYQGLYCL